MAKAYFYQILDKKQPSYVIMEGIVKNSEDTVYPAEYVDEEEYNRYELPYECELHHLSNEHIIVKGFYFDIEMEEAEKHKTDW